MFITTDVEPSGVAEVTSKEMALRFTSPEKAIEFIHKIEDAAQKAWGTLVWLRALDVDRNSRDLDKVLDAENLKKLVNS